MREYGFLLTRAFPDSVLIRENMGEKLIEVTRENVLFDYVQEES